MKSKNNILGVLLSILLVLFGVLALTYQQSISQATGLAPNEIGDFLAGLFAPIALCWLVLGYYQQAREMRENTKALKKQSEEANKHTAAFNKQLKLVSSQLRVQEVSGFLSVYPLRFNELEKRAMSITRSTVAHKRWSNNLDWYGKGYTEVFANTLKNEYLRLGKDEFLKQYDECFDDNRSQLFYYTETFIKFADDAETVDPNIRRIIEMSGIGTAYIAACFLLEKKPTLKYRKSLLSEKGPLLNLTSTRGNNDLDDIDT